MLKSLPSVILITLASLLVATPLLVEARTADLSSASLEFIIPSFPSFDDIQTRTRTSICERLPRFCNEADPVPPPPDSPPPVADTPACSDALDNDGDGKIDFPEDPGCSDNLDQDETDVTVTLPDSTLTVSLAPDTAPAKQVVMGTANNSLVSLRLSADNVDDIKITNLVVTDNITDGSHGVPTFKNLTLWDGANLVGGPLSLNLPNASIGTISFGLDSVSIPKNGSKTLVLRGDTASFSSGGSVSGSTHAFGVSAPNDISAINSSGEQVTVFDTAIGTAQTVFRTQLTLVANSLGVTTSRARSAVDDVATLGFTANPANQATLNAVTLKFSGSAISGSNCLAKGNTESVMTASAPDTFITIIQSRICSRFPNFSTCNNTDPSPPPPPPTCDGDDLVTFTVNLIDTNTNTSLGSATQKTCSVVTGLCSVTFEPVFIIDAGTTKTSKIRINSGNFLSNTNIPNALSIKIEEASDLNWSDGTTNSIGLDPNLAPFNIANIIYE